MVLPLRTARRKNRPQEKTISCKLTVRSALPFAAPSPPKADGKEMKCNPHCPEALAKFTERERGAVASWGGRRASFLTELMVEQTFRGLPSL